MEKAKSKTIRGQAVLAACLAAACGALAGCDANDPLLRSGVWQPNHANRADITMMASNPADLVRGLGAPGSDGQLAAAAVDRLRTNKVKTLPQVGLSQIRAGAQPDGGSGGAAQ